MELQVLQISKMNYKGNNMMTSLSSFMSVYWWFQCASCPLCIILPNFRKQFHGCRKTTKVFIYKACWLQVWISHVFLNLNMMNWSILKVTWHLSSKVKMEMYV